MTTAILVASITGSQFWHCCRICLSVSAVHLLPPLLKTVLVLAAVAICVGCSKQTETPKPPIRWSGPQTGYHGETIPPEHRGPT